MKRKLLADIVSITPSNFDDFLQCERRFLNRQLLGDARERRRATQRHRDQSARAAAHDPCRGRMRRRRARRRRVRRSRRRRRPRASARRPAHPQVPVGRGVERGARGHARPLPSPAAADVHGDGAHRRGVGPRRPARRARLQDRPAPRGAARGRPGGQGAGVRARPGRPRPRPPPAPPVRVPQPRRRPTIPSRGSPTPTTSPRSKTRSAPRSSACARSTTGRASPTTGARVARTARSAATARRAANRPGRCWSRAATTPDNVRLRAQS